MTSTTTRLTSRLLVLCITSICSACASHDDNPYALDLDDDGNVAITEPYRACTVDADCERVNITCDSCCDVDAITATLVDRFRAERERACAAYDGPVCDCNARPPAARCIQQRCAAVLTE